jgi:hypothetical protein
MDLNDIDRRPGSPTCLAGCRIIQPSGSMSCCLGMRPQIITAEAACSDLLPQSRSTVAFTGCVRERRAAMLRKRLPFEVLPGISSRMQQSDSLRTGGLVSETAGVRARPRTTPLPSALRSWRTRAQSVRTDRQLPH